MLPNNLDYKILITHCRLYSPLFFSALLRMAITTVTVIWMFPVTLRFFFFFLILDKTVQRWRRRLRIRFGDLCLWPKLETAD